MPYYVMLSTEKKNFFGAGVTRTSIINSLRQGGISARSYAVGGQQVARTLDKFAELDLQKMGNKVLFDSKYTFLFGTDEQSRGYIFEDLMEYFGDKFGEVDEIALRVPKFNEWLACVTFVDPDGPAQPRPTFQVVALVGSSGLNEPPIVWSQENQPGQLWTTHIEPGPKMIRDIKAFTGRGRWF